PRALNTTKNPVNFCSTYLSPVPKGEEEEKLTDISYDTANIIASPGSASNAYILKLCDFARGAIDLFYAIPYE
ncbi:MAG: hypothetical protein U9Q89_05245, partial [Thermodesulfobacteriota bacterium]|nr:hypothetical protein [Thermodesulfobacteriota bacterium]